MLLEVQVTVWCPRIYLSYHVRFNVMDYDVLCAIQMILAFNVIIYSYQALKWMRRVHTDHIAYPPNDPSI